MLQSKHHLELCRSHLGRTRGLFWLFYRGLGSNTEDTGCTGKRLIGLKIIVWFSVKKLICDWKFSCSLSIIV